MKRHNRNKTILAFLTSLLATSCIGFSSWVFDKSELGKDVEISTNSEIRAVCYNDTTNKKYLTIEKALDEAASGETVYVYPDLRDSNGNLYDITITENCEIAKGVTLTLPFEGTEYERRSEIAKGFADEKEDGVKANRKTLVKINEGVTLTNNGTLLIGGELGIGKSNQRPTGHTAGSYAEILMCSNSKIENNGNLELYGYIKEYSSNNNSTVNHVANSNVKMPLVFYDFRGGKYSSNCYFSDPKIFPLNSFDMPNCHAQQFFYSGSRLIGCVMAFASNKINPSSCVLLSNDESALFSLSDGSLKMKYHSKNCLYTTNDVKSSTIYEDVNYTTVDSNGDLKLNRTSFSLAGETLDTSEFVCPIPQKFRITCESGSLTVSYKMKFLSGSSLTISESASLLIEADTTFYQGYVPSITVGESNLYPSLGNARLLIAGNADISSEYFGGLIEIGGANASLSISNSTKQYSCLSERLDNSNIEKHYEFAKSYYCSLSDAASEISLIVNGSYGSKTGIYWDSEPSQAGILFLNPDSGKSGQKKEADFNVSAVYCIPFVSSDVSFSWDYTTDWGEKDATIKYETENNESIVFHTPANEDNEKAKKYTLTCKLEYKMPDNDEKYTLEKSAVFTADYSSECYTWDTKISLANGSQKLVKDIRCGDEVTTFDHDTGRVSRSVVSYVYYRTLHKTKMLTLNFDKGNSIKIVDNGHCLFDVNENKYVELNVENVIGFVGHRFYGVYGNEHEAIYTLNSFTISECCEEAYSILTANHINCFANNLLNVSDNIEGLYNYFELDESMKVDEEMKNVDINKYGLATYEEWSDYCLESEFDAFNGKYLNVSIGKGLTTRERLQRMMKNYSNKWKLI